MQMTPKEALAKDGTIPVVMGKGRLSKEGIERCKWLVANLGWDIKGYAVDKAIPVSTAAPVAVKQVAAGNEKVIKEYVIKYDEKLYKAVGTDKKVWGMREVCNNCMVSLVQCHCGNPTILGDVSVSIVPQ